MSRKPTLFAFVILLSCLSEAAVSAQRRTRNNAATSSSQPTPARQNNAAPAPAQQTGASQVSEESADLAITATVTAKELVFEVVPNPIVEFPGKPKRDTVWEAERENLPPAVEPGVTYRNIGIRLKITSRFADIERIVAEALGEVPVTDEVKPLDSTTPQQGTQPPPPPSQPKGGSPR